MLDSEYEAGMGALSEIWSHIFLEIEKEEANMPLDGRTCHYSGIRGRKFWCTVVV